MALKPIIENPEEAKNALEHYTKGDDGKYRLQLDGTPPGFVGAEFRDKNIALMKQLKQFEGIDPEEYKTLKAKAAAGDSDDVVKLKLDLASERQARIEAQEKANRAVFETKIADEFLRHGGRADAVEFVVSKAAKVFALKDGTLTSETFSTNAPGQKLTVSEWLTGHMKEAPHLFKPSSGGGAHPLRSGGTGPAANELRNPTPQQLGEHANEIRSGRLKVSYD
jgi:hypothetical protein